RDAGMAPSIPPARHRLAVVGMAHVFRARRSRLLLVPSPGTPRAVVLGQPREPSFEPALQPVDRPAAKLDRVLRRELHLPLAAGADRVRAGHGPVLRRTEPDLPVLDPHRGGPADAALVRSRDEHAES